MEILRWVSDVCFLAGVGIFAVFTLVRLRNAGAFDGVFFLVRSAFTRGKAEYLKNRDKTAKKREKTSRFTKAAIVCGGVCLAVSFACYIALKKAYYA